MKPFFYHTGTERKIVGTVTIDSLPYPDLTDSKEKYVMVDVTTKNFTRTGNADTNKVSPTVTTFASY